MDRARRSRAPTSGTRLVGDLLQRRAEAIVARWAALVPERFPGALAAPLLHDSLPEYLETLAAALHRDPAAGAEPADPSRAVAAAHGVQRKRLGVPVERVEAEYLLLRDVILAEAAGAGIVLTPAEGAELGDLVMQGAAEAKRAFADDARRAEELLELGDALLELDADWRIVRVNANQERLSRLPRDRTLGRVLWEVWPETAAPDSPYWREYHRVAAERVPAEFDAWFAPLGLWTSASVYPVSGGGIVVFFRDATRRKEQEAELQAARAFEQQLIGIVSHDLRNPLNAILLGATALLSRADVPARHHRTLERMRDSAQRATRLIRDLLDLTRARLTGTFPIEPRAADLREVVGEVVEEVSPGWRDREVHVRAEGDAGGTWDPNRLAQVVSNLLTNALKYGAPGRPIQVRIDGRDPACVALEVHNEGDPLPADLLAEPFTPWRRASAADALRGVGLGLFIVHGIVRAHGGEARVASTRADGTTFTVVLPRAGAPAAG